MIRGYFKIGVRNIIKNRLFSVLNISGLAIGMAASILIFFYINFEKSYDRFHTESENIYRLRVERTSESGEAIRFASCCPPAGLRIRELYPEVERVARILRYTGTISFENTMFVEDRLFFAEPEFLEMFDFDIERGASSDALGGQGNILISQSTARKYFGDEDPIGESLELDKRMVFTVAGIFKDIPQNSHLKFDFLLSWPDVSIMYGPEFEEAWGHTGVFTYLSFIDEANIESFENKLDQLVEKEFGEALKYYKLSMELPLQNLKDIHLTSNYMQEYEVNGDKDRVNFLIIVALFLIIIAWVNYIVISTAQAGSRTMEIGLRKVNGASRGQLMGQLFTETIIINSVAFFIAIILVKLAFPSFGRLTGLPVNPGVLSEPIILFLFIVMYLAGVLLAGLYPVIMLSSTRPIKALQGKSSVSRVKEIIRKILVVLQNSISLILLTITLTILSQLSFMKSKELGVNIDNLIAIKAPRVRDRGYGTTLNYFTEQLKKNKDISIISSVTEVPGKSLYWDAGGIFRLGSDQSKNYKIIGTDYNYLDVFNIGLVAGRNFSLNYPSDSMALVLNEKAVNWMGFENPQAAIGQQVDYWGVIYNIIGVVDNFHQQSVKYDFEPTIIRFLPEGFGLRGHIVLKISGENNTDLFTEIEDLFRENFPENPFEFFFVDDYYSKQYKSEETMGMVFGIFAMLTVLITVLGVIGLSGFLVTKRRKEISLRKVLGDNPEGIMILFIKEFLKLVIISSILAIPVSWFILDNWLSTFASRINLGLGLFLIPLILAVIITGLTVISIVYKESNENPIKNLRYE